MKLPAEITRKYYKREIIEYPEGVVKFESSSAGNHTTNLDAGHYDIILVGGGGGGATSSWSSGNGSGAGGGSGGYSLVERLFVETGSYTVTVGGGGGRATAYEHTRATGGTGGTSSFLTYTAEGGTGGRCYHQGGERVAGVGGTGLTQNGNNGKAGAAYNTAFAGGASVYNGYGKGGNGCATNPGGSLIGNTTNGSSGYVKIIALSYEIIVPGTAEDYDFYKDVPIMSAVSNNNKLYSFDR